MTTSEHSARIAAAALLDTVYELVRGATRVGEKRLFASGRDE